MINYTPLKKVSDNRTYNIYLKGYKPACYYCAKTAGDYGAHCGRQWKNYYKRKFRSWKHNRKTQWKDLHHEQ